jgi:hypothetical protein
VVTDRRRTSRESLLIRVAATATTAYVAPVIVSALRDAVEPHCLKAKSA